MPNPDRLFLSGFADARHPWRGRDDELSGTLVLVVGPSGAGKDTLLNEARAHFRGDDTVTFCERLITRNDQTGEKHTAVSDAEFDRLLEAGELFLAWEAHGLHYGVGTSALSALIAGKTVVVNVSRHVICEARLRWPSTQVVYVTASEEARRERLLDRGRESAADIDGRLKRGQARDCPDAEWVNWLDNSGDLADGIARFNALIAGMASERADIGRES